MPSKNSKINILKEKKEFPFGDLEQYEDMILFALAQLRDTEKAKRVKHEDVWKKILG